MIHIIKNDVEITEISPKEAAIQIAFHRTMKQQKEQEQLIEKKEDEMILFPLGGAENATIVVNAKADYWLLLGYLDEYTQIDFCHEEQLNQLPLVAL